MPTLPAALSAGAERWLGRAVEVPAADRDAAALLAPGLAVVTGDDRPGSALARWLNGWLADRADQVDQASGADRASGGDRVYLAGHAQTLQRLRATLRAGGLTRDAIVTKAFWATGRAGL